MKSFCLLSLTALVSSALATNPSFSSDRLKGRQASNSSGLQVDLGYAIYEGTFTGGLNLWQGIRYAAPPTGKLRWQEPQDPLPDRSAVIQADQIPYQCHQTGSNTDTPGQALQYAQNPLGGPTSEDCLFLSIYAPQNASNLPVLVWIHGGGYGLGNGQQNLSDLILANNGGFVGVAIQYRLGAFGFLSSEEVEGKGSVNVGLMDQTFALKWVKRWIGGFGGDGGRVTVCGESAGAGSVMLQSLIYNGTLGTSLFQNAIAASPYLPMQYDYNAYVPTQLYYSFAQAAGCFKGDGVGSPSGDSNIFECLVQADTDVLKNASAIAGSSGNFGTYGFAPVTDRTYNMQLPSQQTQKKQVNGLRILSGNNAEEGPAFVPQNITTIDDLVAYLNETFPLFSEEDIGKVLEMYPSTNSSATGVNFATLGDSGPTAINQSAVGTGQQQRANIIYGESTFVCPSYWLAEGFSGSGHEAYKYQYSVPAALHSSEESAYFGGSQQNIGPDFMKAFMTIWGNFITQNDPSISNTIAAGASSISTSNSSSSSQAPENPISKWPKYNIHAPYQINLNETGGEEYSQLVFGFRDRLFFAQEYRGPGLRNNISLVDAYSWEGGRGARCQFWREVGGRVPE